MHGKRFSQKKLQGIYGAYGMLTGLGEMVYINDLEQRKKIYHQLRALMMEKDKIKIYRVACKVFNTQQ